MAVDPNYVASVCSSYIKNHLWIISKKISLLYFGHYLENQIYYHDYETSGLFNPYLRSHHFVEHLSSYNNLYFYIKVPPIPDSDKGQKYAFFIDLIPDGDCENHTHDYTSDDVIILPPSSSTIPQSVPQIFNDYVVSDSKIKNYIELPFDILISKIVVLAGPTIDEGVLTVKISGLKKISDMVSCDKGLVCSKLYLWTIEKKSSDSVMITHIDMEVRAD